ncbi:hypothetical protein PIB30_034433 [Stylosanthes scabra]|uniref:SKP1 component POZ domain-containing protein n=1 Tax=Stylosanthes scabra TaxID=79078 RepID=A0ABU6SDE6_9FABA|nr:hypothetical protein [Stylosanthes scabra]
MSSTRKITLKSSGGALEVDEAVALESQTVKHIIDDCAESSIPLSNVTIKIIANVIEYCKNTSRLQTLKKKPNEEEAMGMLATGEDGTKPRILAAHARASLLLGRLGVRPLLLMGVHRKHRGAYSRHTQKSFSLLIEYSGSSLHLSPCTRFILVVHFSRSPCPPSFTPVLKSSCLPPKTLHLNERSRLKRLPPLFLRPHSLHHLPPFTGAAT